MRLRGGRTGVRAVTCERLELTGLMQPFDLEVFYGERLAVLGSNGSGKSHFLRLLAGQPVAHTGHGAARRAGGAGLVRADPRAPASWSAARWWRCCTAATAASRAPSGAGSSGARRSACCAATSCTQQADQPFDRMSGGQQARFQVLLLELSGCTLLLLDEPTDNLDLESAEALEDGLAAFDGTVLAVTHDRWFARGLRPLPRLRRRRAGLRGPRAGLGRGPRGPARG